MFLLALMEFAERVLFFGASFRSRANSDLSSPGPTYGAITPLSRFPNSVVQVIDAIKFIRQWRRRGGRLRRPDHAQGAPRSSERSCWPAQRRRHSKAAHAAVARARLCAASV